MTESPRWLVATPFCVAVYLALILVGPQSNSGSQRPDLLGTMLLFLLTALVSWWTSRLVAPDRSRRVLASVLLVVWAGMFGTARLLIGPSLPDLLAAPWHFLLVWSLPFGVLFGLLRRAGTPDPRTVRTLAVASALLVLFQLPGLRPVPDEAVAFGAPPQTGFSLARSTERPDVYLIVLDMFSSPESLSRYYGLEITWFVDSLRQLGFVVPEHARTNYIHTGLVLSSMLNWRPIHEEIRSTGGDPWTGATELIEHAEAWTLLRNSGYRLVFFPSGFPGTARLPSADLTLRPADPPFTRFGQTWWTNTPAELLRGWGCRGEACAARSTFPIPVEGADALRWKLDQIAALPDSAGPIAAFLHFMGSHEPYVFRRDCSERTPWWPMVVDGPDSLEIQRAYADQIHCVATMLIATVTRLLAESSVPPIVLLQADHGNGNIRMLELNARTVGIAQASQRQLHERLEVFAAYHLPDPTGFDADAATPITLLPRVFNRVLGTDLPLNASGSFWSTWQDPLELTEVRWSAADSIHVVAAGP